MNRGFALPAIVILLLALVWYSEVIVRRPQPDEKVHVIYWEKWTGFEGDAMRAVVDEFNREQTRIHVDLQIVSGIENKLLLATAGANPPDVAGLYGANVAAYADDRAVIPLDGYCRKNGISRDLYIPVYWDMGSYNGHQYALPTTPASNALHYNKAMFRAAGLNPERPPQTIEQMDAISQKITTYLPNGKIDKAGFLPAEPGWWNWGWGYFFGGKLWDGVSKITANSRENVRAFTWVQSYTKRYGGVNLSTFKGGLGNFSSPQNGFMSSKVAMELQGVWMYNFITMYAPEMDSPRRIWAAVPFPHPADRPDLANVTFADEDVLVIPRGSRHPNEAFEFIKFVQSQKGMEMLCLGQRKQSPLKVVSADFYARHPNPFIKLFTELPKGRNAVPPPKVGIWFEILDTMTAAFDEVSLDRKTPRQALDGVTARLQPELDDYLMRQRLRAAAGK